MRLSISRSVNSEQFYIIKSFRDETGRSTSKIIEKLGTRVELEEKLGAGVDIKAWGRARAAELTAQEKADCRTVMVGFNPTKHIEAGQRKIYKGGYLFLQKILYRLGIDRICTSISSEHSFDFDLTSILTRLIYGRILEPGSKRATYDFSKSLIEAPDFAPHQVYRALEVLNSHSASIQAQLYKNSKKLIGRSDKILYYDCTNFYFEIEDEDDFRKYGPSKQHQPAPLVQMGLFMDADGIPLAFSMSEGNKNEQTTLTPLESTILKDFNLSKFIVCTDAGLSSLANRKFNSKGERQFITTQSIKKLKGHLKEWALERSGWQMSGTDTLFDLDEIAEILDCDKTDERTKHVLRDKTFYKKRMMKETTGNSKEYFEQQLIVTFSFKYLAYQRQIREGQIQRAVKAIDSNSPRLSKVNAHDFRRFVKKDSVTENGEVADIDAYTLDESVIAKEAAYDGFYGLATSLDDDDIEGILKVNANRWRIEECFRIMKSEFKARPIFLSRQDRISAHFLTCFIALMTYRILEKELDEKFTCAEIVKTLREFNFFQIRGEGYVPAYEKRDLVNELHEISGFRSDFEIVTNKKMKEIIKHTKKR